MKGVFLAECVCVCNTTIRLGRPLVGSACLMVQGTLKV